MVPFKRMNIITGHYGSGKTNLSVNLAFDFAKQGKKTCLVDLDVVNPYFRAADMTEKLTAAGIKVIAPVFANTNLDVPALPPSIYSIFDDKSYTILLDVGGDDAGAAALGQFSKLILAENDFTHFYVVNERRALTRHPREAAEIMSEIEASCHIPVNAIVNNTNLSLETDKDIVLSSQTYVNELSSETNLPVAFTSAEKNIAKELEGLIPELYPVEIYVKVPWA